MMLDDCEPTVSALAQASLEQFKAWIERRLSPRQDSGLPVLVLHGTQVQTGILTDLSETGFGLSKVTSITTDKLISVATEDGRIFEGRVIWTRDGRAGVAMTSRG